MKKSSLKQQRPQTCATVSVGVSGVARKLGRGRHWHVFIKILQSLVCYNLTPSKFSLVTPVVGIEHNTRVLKYSLKS